MATGKALTPAVEKAKAGSYLPMGTLWVPSKVTLEQGRWLVVPKSAQLKEKAAKPDLFDDFIDLLEAKDKPAAVLAFAQTWGLLSVCRHRKHRSHTKECSEKERVSEWMTFAEECRSLLAITNSLLAGEEGDPEDWSHSPFPEVDGSGAIIAVQRRFVEIKVTLLIEAAGVRPTILWTGEEPRIGFAAGGHLFGCVVFELMQRIARNQVAVCSGCGKTYEPKRRPRIDQKNYCEICVENGVPNKERQQAFRRKKKEEQHGKARTE